MIEVVLVNLWETSKESYWVCMLEVEQLGERYALSATAPPELEEEDLQAHFEAMEDQLWQIASQQQKEADILKYIHERQLIRAFVSVVLDEVNLLRDLHGLSPRTLEQLKTAIKSKL